MTETTSHWTERGVDLVCLSVNPRAVAIAGLYAIACAMFGVVGWKILTLICIVYVVHALSLGRRRVEQFGLVFLAAGTAYWIDILPLQEWGAAARTAVTASLQRH